MDVAELAKELELPASLVLEQCQRLGIEAGWVGAELTSMQAVLLRAELASDDIEPSLAPVGGAADATRPVPSVPSAPSVPPPSPERSGGPLPPTSAGSLPGVAARSGGTPDRPFDGGVAGEAPATRPTGRRFDRGVRRAVAALVLAVVLVVGAGLSTSAWLIAVLWLVGAIALIVAIWSAVAARYRISTHPEKLKGTAFAVTVVVLSVLGLVGLGLAVHTVVRAQPAADAPLGLGKREAVNRLRWGYRRIVLVSDIGWQSPAKPAGSCWNDEPAGSAPRREERVELGSDQLTCGEVHRYEVLGTYAVNRDADAPYPGRTSLARTAGQRCAATVDRIRSRQAAKDAPFAVRAEYPTRQGWDDGDHDVTCVAVVDRNGSFLNP